MEYKDEQMDVLWEFIWDRDLEEIRERLRTLCLKQAIKNLWLSQHKLLWIKYICFTVLREDSLVAKRRQIVIYNELSDTDGTELECRKDRSLDWAFPCESQAYNELYAIKTYVRRCHFTQCPLD